MNEIVFKPKHNWFSIAFLSFVIALLGGAFSFAGFALNNLFLIVLGFVLVLLGLVSVAGRSRLIIIGNAEVVMKRLLFPEKVFQYENFTDFNGEMFIFGNMGIPLHDMTNSQEFVEIFLPILEKRNIQSTGKYIADVNRTNKALKYSVVPSLVVTFIAIYFLKKYFNAQYNGEIIGGVIFLVVLFSVYFIIKKMEEYNNEH